MGISERYIKLHEEKIPSLDKVKSSGILTDFVNKEIDQMAWEVKEAEAGKRGGAYIKNKENGQGMFKSINTSTKSTFPQWFRDVDIKTKKRFDSVHKRKSGKVYDKFMEVAIERLFYGYKNTLGYDEPDKEFKSELSSPTPF